MSQAGPDQWGVRSRIEWLRSTSLSERFAGWRESLLAGLDRQIEVGPDPRRDEALDACALAREAERAAFAHLLTDDAGYRRHALDLLDAAGESGGCWAGAAHLEMYPLDRADLQVAETTKAFANVLSWLWPGLDDDSRRRLATVIADRGGRVIYEDAEKGCWWADALNSNWTSVLNSGLGFAGLIWRHYSRTEAGCWVNRARGTIVRMLDLAAEEGAGVEGPGYWLYCFASAQDLVEALANEDGDDLYLHPFWARCSRFLPYLALPDMSGWIPYADTGRGALSGSAFFHGVASRTRDPLAQWFGNEILRQSNDATWKSVVYYDETVSEQPVGAIPPCRHFRSVQLASFRSSWAPDAALFMFKGGSNAWSHTHLDLGSFYVAVGGEALATDPGPWPYRVHLWHSVEPAVSTSWHNCIVVDGANQRMGPQYAMSHDLEEAGDCYSRLVDHVSSEHVEMIRGDATTAYGDALDRASRDVVYLKPDVFVIFDDLLARPARVQRNFEWMLHSEHLILDTDGSLLVQGERSSLSIRPVFPRDCEWKHVMGKTIPRDGRELHCISLRPYWHHKWNVDPARSPYPHWDPRGDSDPLYSGECRFLVVLQAAASGAPRMDVEGFELNGAMGVRIAVRDERWVVLFNRAGRTVDLGDLQTDAEKAVLGERAGRATWAVVRGTQLVWNGRTLLAGEERTSRAGP